MSVDDRLRDGLARNASAHEPDVERHLRQVRGSIARPRRPARIGHWWIPAAVACAVLALVLSGVVLHVRRPSPAPTTPITSEQLTGRLTAILPDRPGALRTDGLAGTWVLRLRPDGTVRATAPSTYHGVLSAALFESTAHGFRTSLFGQDLCSGIPIGAYSWQRVGAHVQFTLVDDRCAGRVAVLTAVDWRVR